MRFLFGIFLSLFLPGSLFAGEIANVDFIHKYINQKHGLSISIANPSQQYWAANVKYMLCTVDVANEMLNGFASTNYCTSPYATTVAVDRVTAIDGIDTLIQALCGLPCSGDIYDAGKVMKCVSGNLTCVWSNCESSMPIASCGCPPGTNPDGDGGCELILPCIAGSISYQNGKICTCVGGIAWQCNTNCPTCDTTCGCPVGQIPDGNGNCVTGLEPCVQGNVGYYLQPDGTTILAKDCPMSGFRDFCPLINSKVICPNFHYRPGWGDAYYESCCTDEWTSGSCPPITTGFGAGKACPLGGNEYSFMAVQGGSNRGTRMVFIDNIGGQLIVAKGKCRRPYDNEVGTKGIDMCRQGAENLSAQTNPYLEQCTGGTQFNVSPYYDRWLSDFPLSP